MRWRDFAVIAGGALVIYLPLSFFPAPDLPQFAIPWLEHIKATGPIAAFERPFSNYTPPYLYLLSLFSLLGLPSLATIKLLSILGACWLAWCVGRLAAALGCDPLRGAERALLLPTVILNSAVLGQCDTLWAGCCVLAVAEAVKERPYRMALWAGIGFAIKAQSAFLAPFCIGYLIQKRAWGAVAIPPLVYLLAIAPAAMAGWPLADLLTIYIRQTQFTFIGDAPNLWAIPAALNVPGPAIFPIGYALGAVAAVAVAALRGRDPLQVALLAALIIPFLLPKMLERFFFLADVLSLTIAYVRRDRASIVVAILVQTGSFLSIAAYLAAWPWLNALASLFMGAALFLVLMRLSDRSETSLEADRRMTGPSQSAAAPGDPHPAHDPA